MPKLTPSRTATEMERFAFDLHKDVTEGPGTPAARLKRLHDLLCEFATQNYEAGQAAEVAKQAKEKAEGPAQGVQDPVKDVPGQQTLSTILGEGLPGEGVAGIGVPGVHAQHSGSAPAPAGGVSGGVG